jgi:hypothetical protein
VIRGQQAPQETKSVSLTNGWFTYGSCGNHSFSYRSVQAVLAQH